MAAGTTVGISLETRQALSQLQLELARERGVPSVGAHETIRYLLARENRARRRAAARRAAPPQGGDDT